MVLSVRFNKQKQWTDLEQNDCRREMANNHFSQSSYESYSEHTQAKAVQSPTTFTDLSEFSGH